MGWPAALRLCPKPRDFAHAGNQQYLSGKKAGGVMLDAARYHLDAAMVALRRGIFVFTPFAFRLCAAGFPVGFAEDFFCKRASVMLDPAE
ncbi:MAG TPA: hypothetical protein VFE47_19510 [Tepidisphaeraceae bacterium]|nr:hypothetical protein [Tepidisphaeraceae bacterium]